MSTIHLQVPNVILLRPKPQFEKHCFGQSMHFCQVYKCPLMKFMTKAKLQDCHYAVWFSFDHQDIWGSWECSWPFWMRPKQENYPQIKKQQCWFWGLSWDPWKTSITDSTFKRDKLEAQLSHEVALNICNKCNRKREHSGVVCNTASLQEGPGFKSSLPVYTWDVPVMIC